MAVQTVITGLLGVCASDGRQAAGCLCPDMDWRVISPVGHTFTPSSHKSPPFCYFYPAGTGSWTSRSLFSPSVGITSKVVNLTRLMFFIYIIFFFFLEAALMSLLVIRTPTGWKAEESRSSRKGSWHFQKSVNSTHQMSEKLHWDAHSAEHLFYDLLAHTHIIL